MTDTTAGHLFDICEKNNDKQYIRNIHIKCTIINTVQYRIAEDVPFIFQHHKNDKTKYQALILSILTLK